MQRILYWNINQDFSSRIKNLIHGTELEPLVHTSTLIKPRVTQIPALNVVGLSWIKNLEQFNTYRGKYKPKYKILLNKNENHISKWKMVPKISVVQAVKISTSDIS